jgi:hypothetical protein
VALPILVFLVFSMKPTKSNSVFQPGSSIKKKFGVSTKTLQTWSDTGKLETVRLPGGKRLYSLPALNTLLGAEQLKNQTSICYAWVSSIKQAGDLERQTSVLQQFYPGHKIIQDIGSGLNWKRTGLNFTLSPRNPCINPKWKDQGVTTKNTSFISNPSSEHPSVHQATPATIDHGFSSSR